MIACLTPRRSRIGVGGGYSRRKLAQVILMLMFSFDLPPEVEIEEGVEFLHNCTGTVIHPLTTIRAGALIMQGVTIGDANMHRGEVSCRGVQRIVIGRDATICCGAKVLGREGTLSIGERSIVGANAVLLESIGDGDVWVGIPARRVK